MECPAIGLSGESDALTTASGRGEVAAAEGKECVMHRIIGRAGNGRTGALRKALLNRHFPTAARELRRHDSASYEAP
ncbi:hypothetical protein GCM10014713_37320 [Streptomyces purpureus]|uniref:Uncharacterized protein n=1 Tax=Streptomyces purpureus TaxID=1951 RepID=A0A918LRP8_9ACTN|nr:hypothetical protein GCM10014713_37320 [Streptomyces purpureus]